MPNPDVLSALPLIAVHAHLCGFVAERLEKLGVPSKEVDAWLIEHASIARTFAMTRDPSEDLGANLANAIEGIAAQRPR